MIKKIGFALTGSYCTFSAVIPQIAKLCEEGYEVYPILSYNVSKSDTRFYKSEDLKAKLTELTGKTPIATIVDAEPIGPKKLLDLLIVAPCTGNTVAKLALGITDTPVTMAAKAQLRNDRPVLIGVSTNDALSTNAKNIGLLMNMKNIFLVPLLQDDFKSKKDSLVADMDYINECCKMALMGIQAQPVYLPPKGY